MLVSEQESEGPAQGNLSATRKAPELKCFSQLSAPGAPIAAPRLPKRLPGTGSSPLLGQSIPVLASSVSKSVPSRGLNLLSNSSPFPARRAWVCCFSMVTSGHCRWGGRLACCLAISAFHLTRDLKALSAVHHTRGPPLVTRLVIGPSGRASVAWGVQNRNGLRSQRGGPDKPSPSAPFPTANLTPKAFRDTSLESIWIFQAMPFPEPTHPLSAPPSFLLETSGRDPSALRLRPCPAAVLQSASKRVANSLTVTEEVHKKGELQWSPALPGFADPEKVPVFQCPAALGSPWLLRSRPGARGRGSTEECPPAPHPRPLLGAGCLSSAPINWSRSAAGGSAPAAPIRAVSSA